MDHQILVAISHLACPPLDVFFKSLTFLGNGGLIWLMLTLGLLLYRRTRPTAWIVFVSLLAAALITTRGLKPLFMRAPRFRRGTPRLPLPQPGPASACITNAIRDAVRRC